MLVLKALILLSGCLFTLENLISSNAVFQTSCKLSLKP